MSRAPCILVVDDDPALLDALPTAVRLRMPGVRVHTADSAPAALQLISELDPDVIVTDIKMPGMDGLALLIHIQELRPETPTLLISGHGEHDLTIRALRGGAYDFIQKPIDRDYFMAAVQRALHTRALRRQNAAQQEELERHAARLEAAVAERTRELQKANEAKDEFLGMISHEMRTPLTLIRGGVDVLRRRADALDSEGREALLEDIESEAERLTRMVEDLLVLARAEVGHIGVTEPVSLAAVANRVVQSARGRMSREISVTVEPDMSPVAAEQTYLERILENLLSNADKYSHRDAPIRVVASPGAEGMGELRVIDAGPGVSEDEIPLIFDRFFRSSVSASHAPGVGLGLTVCKRLVEAMSGRAWARRVDEGFEVGFAVPVYVHADADYLQPGAVEPVH